MPVRVQALMTRYPHWGRHSGLSQFLRHLDADQYHVASHLSSDSDDDFPIQSPTMRNLFRRRVRRGGMPWYKLSDLVAETKALVSCLARNTDVVHYLDAEHGAQYLPLFKRYNRVPLIATYHQPLSVIGTLLRRDVVEKLDHVTLVSPEQLSYFEEILPRSRISVILHGIDTEFFRPREASSDDDTFICLTVGHWLRDYEAILAVAKRLAGYSDIRFHLVSSRIDGIESTGNVVVRTNLTDEELRYEYQHAGALLLPLLDCTANNALLEAIACGLPVISTALGSVRAYLPGAEGVLVENNDPEQLADAVLRLKADTALRGAMSRAARTRAQELSWHHVAEEYASVYRSLVPSTG